MYTYTQLQQMLAEIPTLNEHQLLEKYHTDTHEDALLGIQEEIDFYFPDEEKDEEAYWNAYAEDMIIERRKERALWTN